MDRSSDIRRRRDRGRSRISGTVHGEAQKLGNGLAQIYAELDAEGAPRVIGVSFDRRMLEDLPEMPNTYSRCFDKNANGRIDDHHECNGDYELAFALPEELARTTPFKWVSVNRNPMGHPPPAPPVWRCRTSTFTSTSWSARRCGRSGRGRAAS